MLAGRTKVVMQYPEEKWDNQMPPHYRGAPTLVKQMPAPTRRFVGDLSDTHRLLVGLEIS